MQKVYHYHPMTGLYLGSSDAKPSPLEEGVFLCPAHATFDPAPEADPGHHVVRSGDTWAQEPDVIPEPEPEPTPEDIQESRRKEILVLLGGIDAESVRPLRAIVAGVATNEDRTKLADLESQANVLRDELAGLTSDSPSG